MTAFNHVLLAKENNLCNFYGDTSAVIFSTLTIFLSLLCTLLRKDEFLCCELGQEKLRTVPQSPDTKAPGPPKLINRCVLVPSQAQPLMAKQGPSNCEELKAKYWLYLLSNKRAMKLI